MGEVACVETSLCSVVSGTPSEGIILSLPRDNELILVVVVVECSAGVLYLTSREDVARCALPNANSAKVTKGANVVDGERPFEHPQSWWAWHSEQYP